MKQSTDRNTLPCQRVVELSRFACLQYVAFHPQLVQPIDRLGARLQDKIHTARQYNNGRAMVDELGEVGDLDAWNVAGVCLAPIPWASTPGPKFHVLRRPEAIDFHDSPG